MALRSAVLREEQLLTSCSPAGCFLLVPSVAQGGEPAVKTHAWRGGDFVAANQDAVAASAKAFVGTLVQERFPDNSGTAEACVEVVHEAGGDESDEFWDLFEMGY